MAVIEIHPAVGGVYNGRATILTPEGKPGPVSFVERGEVITNPPANFYMGISGVLDRRFHWQDDEEVSDSPALHAVPIVPSDSGLLEVPTRAIYVGYAGDVRVLTITGKEALFNAVAASTTIPVRAQRVFETQTTASGLLGLW